MQRFRLALGRILLAAGCIQVTLLVLLVSSQKPAFSAAGTAPPATMKLLGAVDTPQPYSNPQTEVEFQLPGCTTGMVVDFLWDHDVVRSETLRATGCDIDARLEATASGGKTLGQHLICVHVRGGSVHICRPFLIVPLCKGIPPPCFIGGMGGGTPLSPEQQQAAQIQADINSLQSGEFALWLPARVAEGDNSDIVTLTVGAHLAGAELSPSATGPVSKIGNVMSAKLSVPGDPQAVVIERPPGDDGLRTVSTDQAANWAWTLRPQKWGQYRLHVEILVRLAGLGPDVPPIAFPLTEDRTVSVGKNTAYEMRTGLGVVTNWNWPSIGAIVAVLAALAGALKYLGILPGRDTKKASAASARRPPQAPPQQRL